MLMRLQKFLAEANVASRRKSEEIILEGRVKVNGEVIKSLGTKVESEKDVVFVDNKEVKIEENLIYVILNKPLNCVTTVKDQFGRKSVLDYVSEIKERIYPVGRLDYDTSGLLILTNDGELTFKLTHPKHYVEKTYIARVDKLPKEKELERFRNGLLIDGKMTSKAKIRVIDKKSFILEIKIYEGRNRQVRKMCAEIGANVKELKRIKIGNLELGNLKSGQYRKLSESEVKYLKSLG